MGISDNSWFITGRIIMLTDGEEIYIDKLETQILRVIGEHNMFVKEVEVIEILETLTKKLKGLKNENT